MAADTTYFRVVVNFPAWQLVGRDIAQYASGGFAGGTYGDDLKNFPIEDGKHAIMHCSFLPSRHNTSYQYWKLVRLDRFSTQDRRRSTCRADERELSFRGRPYCDGNGREVYICPR